MSWDPKLDAEIEDERLLFEAWVSTDFRKDKLNPRNALQRDRLDGHYKVARTWHMWRAWCASRDLPSDY